MNDVVSTLEMGAAGIVLAAETAIGNKPLLSVEIVKELIHRFSLYKMIFCLLIWKEMKLQILI